MKKSNILSLLLSMSMLCALIVPGATAYADDNTDNGMKISKTATANDDGSYTITLEAYATGSKVISQETKDVPADIILVLDQSGSMAFCIGCGEKINSQNQTHNIYVAVDTVNTDSQYYIKNGTEYTRVYYCDGTHSSVKGSSRPCSGGAGWYTSTQISAHTSANKITPKTSSTPGGTQFYSVSTEGCSSRLSALKSAATNFANQVATKAKGKDGTAGTDDDVDHQIAVVGYAGESRNLTNGFKQMNDEGQAADVSSTINNLTANGGTYIDQGLSTANSIFASNPIGANEKRNRVIIVFTDGAPGLYGNWGAESVQTANSAIAYANTAKKSTSEGGYGATVYTIGIFSGADASNPNSLPDYTSPDWGDKVSDANQVKNSNRFMHLLSSNYPAASSINQPGSIKPNSNGKSYYLSAGDAGTLNNIFEQISSQIESGGSSTTLSSKTVIKDIIAPQFTLPAGATTSNITLETYACTGKDGENYTWSNNGDTMGAKVAITSTDTSHETTTHNQVSVTGFNFADNYVCTVTENGSTTYRGNKLVITFKVEPRSDFLGGNNVITNTSAGVYENNSAETPVMTFDQPQVNVPIKAVAVTAEDKNVYLLNDLTADELKAGATVKVGEEITLDLSKATDANKPYGLEKWQTEYVNITVEIKDKDGNVILDSALQDLQDDKNYTVAVTVAPKSNGSGASGTPATAKSGSDDANINVYKPEVTFEDGTVYYGEQVPNDKWLGGS